MKFIILILTIIFQEMPNVAIHQDSAITNLIERKATGETLQMQEVNGYRVQIYSSNQQQQAKAEALQVEKMVKEKISEAVYISYSTPFWKVRIGNYRTIEEAQVSKEEIIRIFPQLQSSTYVVRDKIQVRE